MTTVKYFTPSVSKGIGKQPWGSPNTGYTTAIHEAEMTKNKTEDTMEEQVEAKIVPLHPSLFHAGLQITLHLAFPMG